VFPFEAERIRSNIEKTFHWREPLNTTSKLSTLHADWNYHKVVKKMRKSADNIFQNGIDNNQPPVVWATSIPKTLQELTPQMSTLLEKKLLAK